MKEEFCVTKDVCLLDLNNNHAQQFFISGYSSLMLPEFFDFTKLLNKIKDCEIPIPKDTKGHSINYHIEIDKSTKYDYRTCSLINPILYTGIIQTITQETSWKEIQEYFNSIPNIECKSNLISTLEFKFRICEKIPVYDDFNKEDNCLIHKNTVYMINGETIVHKNLSTKITCHDDNSKIKKEIKSYINKTEYCDLIILPCKITSSNAKQVTSWYKNFEQLSINQALYFKYIFHADIFRFYDSIYIHTVCWALCRGEQEAFNQKTEENWKNKLDIWLTKLNNQNTVGLLSGSYLSGFIAEILMKFIDNQLIKEIEKNNIDDYKILRYRDDYRIFVNKERDGEEIVSLLSKVLSNVKLRLNSAKVFNSNNIVCSSVKPEKLKFLNMILKNKSKIHLQNYLINIRLLADEFGQSGHIVKYLHKINLTKTNIKFSEHDSEILIAILVDIAYISHKYIPLCMYYIGFLISNFIEQEKKKVIYEAIYKKLSTMQCPELFYLWFIRMIIKSNIEISDYKKTKLCEAIGVFKNNKYISSNNNVYIWDFTCFDLKWCNQKLLKIIQKTSIVNNKFIKDMPNDIKENEVSLFLKEY